MQGNNANGRDEKDVSTKRSNDEMKTWYRDYYESAVVQRNFFIFLSAIGILATVLSVLAIRHIKNTKSIEPFVIEIERKTGIATVVDPLTTKEYSADDAVRRSLIVQYIKAREEYFFQTYARNYYNVVRAFSSSSVYSGYKSLHSKNNVSSNYSRLGKFGTAQVHFKSIIFTDSRTAQVRLSIRSYAGTLPSVRDKIVLISFDFSRNSMSEGDRYINPLGFSVNLYRIEDEYSSK